VPILLNVPLMILPSGLKVPFTVIAAAQVGQGAYKGYKGSGGNPPIAENDIPEILPFTTLPGLAGSPAIIVILLPVFINVPDTSLVDPTG